MLILDSQSHSHVKLSDWFIYYLYNSWQSTSFNLNVVDSE